MSVLACSPKRYVLEKAADALDSTSEGGAFARDDDPELVRDAVPFALKSMESLADQLPDDAGLRIGLARGFTQYGFAFVEQPNLARCASLRTLARSFREGGWVTAVTPGEATRGMGHLLSLLLC